MVAVTGLRTLGGLTSSMAPQLEIKFEPTIIVTTGHIDKLGLSFRSFREPLTKAVRKVIGPSIWENFESGGRPKWPPLAEATMEIRARYGHPGSDPLVWTGALSEIASSPNIWTITQNYATITDLPANVWYGKIHQAGYAGAGTRTAKTSKGKHDKSSLYAKQRALLAGKESTQRGGAAPIPARPFIMFQPEDEAAIAEIFGDWLDKKIQQAWPKGT